MTELDKIAEFAKRKNVTFRIDIEHKTRGAYEIEKTVFVFGYGSVYPLINVPFITSEYNRLLGNKKLAEQVVYIVSSELADIKAREEVKKDMEFLKTLKED